MSQIPLFCQCGNLASKLCIHAVCGYCCFDKDSCPKHRRNQKRKPKPKVLTESQAIASPEEEFEVSDDLQLAQLQQIVFNSVREFPFDIVQFIIAEYLDSREECSQCVCKKLKKDMQQCSNCNDMFCCELEHIEQGGYCFDCWPY